MKILKMVKNLNILEIVCVFFEYTEVFDINVS